MISHGHLSIKMGMKYASFYKDVCKPMHFRSSGECKSDENLTLQLHKSELKLHYFCLLQKYKETKATVCYK